MILGWSQYSVAKGPSSFSIIDHLQLNFKVSQLAQEQLSTLHNPQFHNLKIQNQTETAHLKTTKLQHYYKGLEVIGSSVLIHEKGADHNVTSELMKDFQISTVPTFDASTIEIVAQGKFPNAKLNSLPTLKILPENDGESFRLVYWTQKETLGRLSDVIIDAHSGEVIAELPLIREIATVHVLSAKKIPKQAIDPFSGAPYTMKPYWLRLEASSNKDTSSVTDTSVNNALSHFDKILSFFQDRFGLDSYDNKGTSVISVVHVGKDFANAYWDPTQKVMAFGDGDGSYLKDMSTALDVTGHEFSHAIASGLIKTKSYEGLMPYSESGALGEALSDYFGETIESLAKGHHSWTIGEELYINPALAVNGMRNMKDPKSKKSFFVKKNGKETMKEYPAHMDEKFESFGACNNNNDYCYVHTNSTIITHSLYLLSQSLDEKVVSELVFHSIAHYLTPMSGFKSFAKAMATSCKDLSLSASDCDAVDDSLIQVGL